MKCDECGRVINNPIVERAVYGIATYFNCEKCFNSKYLNDNGIREGEQSALTYSYWLLTC